MIRPFRWETQRYGDVSTMEDSMYDHPFQWGSKRTGPDLAREGGKTNNLWHYLHFTNPRDVEEASNMPPYAFLKEGKVDSTSLADRMRAMRAVGVPYTNDQIDHAAEDAAAQGEEISASLLAEHVTLAPDTEMTALIAYVQRLGRRAE